MSVDGIGIIGNFCHVLFGVWFLKLNVVILVTLQVSPNNIFAAPSCALKCYLCPSHMRFLDPKPSSQSNNKILTPNNELRYKL